MFIYHRAEAYAMANSVVLFRYPVRDPFFKMLNRSLSWVLPLIDGNELTRIYADYP